MACYLQVNGIGCYNSMNDSHALRLVPENTEYKNEQFQQVILHYYHYNLSIFEHTYILLLNYHL